MKKKFLLAVLSLSTLAVYGCSNNDSTPTVQQDVSPSYKGMSVTRTTTSNLQSSSVKERVDLSELVTQNVVNDPTIRYYVNPGESFRLHVCLSNPSKYEIQSLTLNGKKYASYMFAEGSDLENIYIEVTAPIESGYQSYTLENMKYLDETTVKDLSIAENNTLSVGVRYTNSPVAEFNDMKISATSFSTNLQVSDKDNLIASQSLRLYISDGKDIISQKALEVGNNLISLNTLSCGNTYQIGVLGQVDMADGRGQHYEWLAKEEFMTDDVYDFENVTYNENSVRFDLKKKYSLDSTSINRIDLEIDGDVKDSITGESNYSFRNLLSDTEYTLALHYIADEKKTDKVVRTSFTSAAYKTPSLSLSCQTATVNSLELKIAQTDEDELLSSVNLSLYDESGNVAASTKKDDIYLFENLKSDSKYTAFLSYTYDARDGKGEAKKSIQQTFSTLKNEVPVAKEINSEIKKGCDSLTVSYELSNQDIGTIDSLTLLKDGAVVKIVNESKAIFDSLSEDTDYSVLVDYSYDLNDGKGKKTGQKEFQYHTNPSLTIASIDTISPKEKYSAGETIELKIGLHNTKNLTISNIYINSVSCSLVAFNNYVLASYVIPSDTFQAGENSLSVTSLQAKDGQNTYSYEFVSSEENHFVFQYEAAIEVENIQSDNELDYCNLNDEIHAKLNLKNVLNQTLTSVTLSDGTTLSITKNDAGEYLVALPSDTAGLHSYHITAVNYTQNEETSQAYHDQIIQYYVLPNQTAISITNVEQFMTMEEGKTYRLDADLDFSNVDYTPFAFKGVLRGNNHKIKNLNLTITAAQSEGGNYGLFSSLEGFVDNLAFENAFICCNNTLSGKAQRFGFLSGSSSNVCVRNVNIDESCIMKLGGANGQNYMHAAGLIGLSEGNIIIDDSRVSAIFWSTYKSYNVTGLVSAFYGGGNFATFKRNILDFSYSNANATGSGSFNIYVLSSYATEYRIDVSDLLVDINCSKKNSYSTMTINMTKNCTLKVNHMVDLSTRKGISTLGIQTVSIFNSFYLTEYTGSLVEYQNCIKEQKNALVNDSYYNGETDTVKLLEDINYYFDVCGFDKDVWEFPDPCYEKFVGEYGNDNFRFKTPTLNRKIKL